MSKLPFFIYGSIVSRSGEVSTPGIGENYDYFSV